MSLGLPFNSPWYFLEAVNLGSRHWSNCSISWNAINVLGGGFKDFWTFHLYLGKMNPFWLIFFRWVGSTTNQCFFLRFHFLSRIPLFWWVCCCLASAYPRLPKCPFYCVAISTSFIHPFVNIPFHTSWGLAFLGFPFTPPNTYGMLGDFGCLGIFVYLPSMKDWMGPYQRTPK